MPFGGRHRCEWLVDFFVREKYCHNGGMAFAHEHAIGCSLGVKMAVMALRGPPRKGPFYGAPKTADQRRNISGHHERTRLGTKITSSA
jgi:hypothetical protein